MNAYEPGLPSLAEAGLKLANSNAPEFFAAATAILLATGLATLPAFLTSSSDRPSRSVPIRGSRETCLKGRAWTATR